MGRILVSFKRPVVLLLLAVGAGTFAFGEDGRAESSFTFVLKTPEVRTVVDDEGRVEILAEGLDTLEFRPGFPDLPTKTILVAIPAGVEPRLEILSIGRPVRRDARPRSVPRIAVDPSSEIGARSPEGEQGFLERASAPTVRVYRPDPSIYERSAMYPPAVAWLGNTGVLRDQRYVKVHLAPIRYDGASGGMQLVSSIEVVVHFDGASPGKRAGAPVSRFEPVYRNAFANYAQGRGFRLKREVLEAQRGLGRPLKSMSGDPAPIRRLRVREDGPVRLDHVFVQANAPELLGTNPNHWRLTSRGEAIPLHVHQSAGGDDELFEPGEWVQFYGEAFDDEPKTVMSHDNGGVEDLHAVRDFTDETPYFLTLEVGSQPTMAERDATPPGGAVEPHFPATVHVELDDRFHPLPEEIWFWNPVQGETTPVRSEIVQLPGLASGTLDAHVRLTLRGASTCFEVDPDHKTLVGLENNLAETLELPAGNTDNDGNSNVGVFDGNVLFKHDFAWEHSAGEPVLTDPMTVTLAAADLDIPCPSVYGGNTRNDVVLDWIEIDYRRVFTAVGDVLTFDFPDGDAEFEVAGLSSPEIDVYEVTGQLPGGPADAVRLTGAVGGFDGFSHTVRFAITDDGLEEGTLRRFVVVGGPGATLPDPSDIELDRVSDLVTDDSQADLVIIAHPDLVESRCSEGGGACSYDVDCTAGPTDVCEIDPAGDLGQFVAHRAPEISSRVARIQDVYDEFNHGLPGPVAIRNFLAWVFSGGWQGEPPSFVMLLGDGSYDYKAGTSEGNFVPTQMMVKNNDTLGYFSSDNSMANVVGEGHLADMVAGRLTARTPAEATTLLQKVLHYETDLLPGLWNTTMGFISDRGKGFDEFEALEFERINDIGADMLDGTAYAYHKLRYWTDNCNANPPVIDCDPDLMNQEIIDCINAGIAMAQFTGHGNFNLWSDDVFFCANEDVDHPRCNADDTELLVNGFRMPWLVVNNCLTGGFHTPQEKSFGEQWIKHDGGGAVAVFAPSGLGFRYLGSAVAEIIWEDIFGGRKIRAIAIPVMDSLVQLCGQGAIEGCQFYTLLGDPSLTLRLPHIEPPSDLQAVASTGPEARVDLSWSPSATPGTVYHVYRTDDLDFDHVKITDDEHPLTETTYSDEGEDVTHTQEYFYYVVGVDQGYESAWSNFNSDCGNAEPIDCVTATPMNFQPPAVPNGLVVTDAETGGRLDLSWVSNIEPDFHFYTVHYGLTPGMEQSVTLYGKGYSEFALGGLQDGSTYYVGISGTNTSGTQSATAGPVEAVPTLIVGERAPGLVSDLRLARSGQDALLTWGPVTEDIYGKPEGVAFYEVYRDITPQFEPSPANRIGQPAGTSFLDVGALVPGGPDYNYLVRAVDLEGNAGGLGRQLPAGILDLTLAKPDEEHVLLEWSAVTTDMDDEPTVISHYEVYAADTPFGRGDIRDGNVGLLTTVSGATSLEIVPEAASRYYSVLAVDVRGNLSPF